MKIGLSPKIGICPVCILKSTIGTMRQTITTLSPRPRKYWNTLKTKLKPEGSELSHKLGQLKMEPAGGKFYKTVTDTNIFTSTHILKIQQRSNSLILIY
jgi:hypothetical protein